MQKGHKYALILLLIMVVIIIVETIHSRIEELDFVMRTWYTFPQNLLFSVSGVIVLSISLKEEKRKSVKWVFGFLFIFPALLLVTVIIDILFLLGIYE